MASPQRMSVPTLDSHRTTLRGLRTLSDYAPLNEAYTTEALLAIEAALEEAEQEELRLHTALDLARLRAIEAGHRFHNAMLGAKAQVIAQYGDDSHAVELFGLTRKSERKRPARRKTSAAD